MFVCVCVCVCVGRCQVVIGGCLLLNCIFIYEGKLESLDSDSKHHHHHHHLFLVFSRPPHPPTPRPQTVSRSLAPKGGTLLRAVRS